MADAHQIWRDKFAEKFARERTQEEERRKVAFLDLTYSLCGEEVRTMTARDMLLLDGLRSPFLVGGQIAPAHIPQFIWLLSVDNDLSRPLRTSWKKGRLIGRSRKWNYDEAVAAIDDYIGEMFLDAPAGGKPDDGERRGIQTCFLAPLLLRLASEIGATDPASGLPLIESPLPRLFQYLKTMRAKAEGKEFNDSSPSDRLINEWLIEVNAQMGADQLAAQKNN
jgi:hypothetical protein